MNETTTSQINSLSWLIPTGENDIAVREVLIPIFGNAVSCKVPGAPCNTSGSFDAATSNGSLVEAIMSVFNSGTLVFATILLIFIGLIGFIKTANDGEFFGKSWNTTFSALRLVAGIAFILPMPNNYSSIQNFVLYVGLWSSGFANQLTLATSDHYLARLQNNMIKQDPNASSLDGEAKDILLMHICASLTQNIYAGQGAALKMERTSTSEAAKAFSAPSPAADSSGLPPFQSNKIELAYVERGTFLTPGTVPCGRVVLDLSIDPARDVKIASGIPNNAWGSGVVIKSMPLSDKARDMIANELAEVAGNARTSKAKLIEDMASPNSPLRGLADKIVAKYATMQITFNEDGSIKSAPGAAANTSGTPSPTAGSGAVSAEEGVRFIGEYTSIVRKANQDYVNSLNAFRTQVLEKSKGGAGKDSFFGQMKIISQDQGWMGTASTYRTMLDMTSLQFIGEAQKPFKIENRDEIAQAVQTNVPGGLYQQFRSVSSMTNRLLDSDTAKTIYDQQQINPPNVTNSFSPTNDGLMGLATKKPSVNDIMDTMYGGGFLQNTRTSVLKHMTISADYDPLYQSKALGDRLALTSETLIGGEMLARGIVALGIIFKESWADALTAGVGGGLVEAFKYLSESIFTLIRTLAGALAVLSYAFSTWIPAIPFVAFLLAQLGWLFGLIMTLFAINLWGVMHITPARNDSFIGSEAQGYLLLLALFFRPAIATAALSLSFIVAPPVMKLINITLIPMLMASSASTNVISICLQLVFGLVLYVVIVKGAILMIFMTPQSFPDEVMRIISAGIGDLGQSKALSTMEAGEGSGRMAQQTIDGVSRAGSDHFKGMVNSKKEALADRKAKADELAKPTLGRPGPIDGAMLSPTT